MEPRIRKLQVKRTAHIAEIGNDISKAKQIWLVLHGYGQLANRIVRKFNHLNLDEIYTIAPEGLNKFYWTDENRTPVATWMTKHERLDEIQNYLDYLDQVYTTIIEPQLDHAKFNVLSFSQGTATMWRWVTHRQPKLAKLIMWAGEFPPEPDYKSHQAYLSSINTQFVYGDQDQFIKESYKEKILKQLEENVPNMKIIKYQGGHRIDRDVLSKIVLEA